MKCLWKYVISYIPWGVIFIVSHVVFMPCAAWKCTSWDIHAPCPFRAKDHLAWHYLARTFSPALPMEYAAYGPHPIFHNNAASLVYGAVSPLCYIDHAAHECSHCHECRCCTGLIIIKCRLPTPPFLYYSTDIKPSAFVCFCNRASNLSSHTGNLVYVIKC